MKNVCGLTPVVHCFLCLAEPALGLWAKVQREDKGDGRGARLVPGAVLHLGDFLIFIFFTNKTFAKM